MDSWTRLEQVIGWSGLTINAFALSLGLKRAENLYQIKKGKNAISKDLAELISTKYCNISKSWLLTGEGTMFMGEDKPIERGALPGKGIPYYEFVPVSSGGEEIFSNPLYYVDIPMLSHCDIAIPCVGDSMSPDIPSGAVVLLKEIDPELILSGEIYFIVTDAYSVIRKIRSVDGDDSRLRLLPGNVGAYDELVLKKSFIRRLFLVKGVVSPKVL